MLTKYHIFLCTAKHRGAPYNMEDILNTRNVVPTYRTAELNLEEIAVQDSVDESNGVPPRFGYKHRVDLTTNNTGRWTNLPDGGSIWELDIYCPGALSINFTFKEFWLPPSGRLFVYNPETQQKIGAFTSWNNKGSKTEPLGFATGLLYGEKVRIEYREAEGEESPIISLSGIVHGYKYINISGENTSLQDGARAFGASGACQVNINCSPEGDDWQDEKTGVALMIIDGTRVCSGSLINNSCRNGEPYFLTANHCIATAGFDAIDNSFMATSSFIWNYEAPNCSNPSSEPSTAFMTNGAHVRANVLAGANTTGTDFALLELLESPNSVGAAGDIAFNGWSRVLPQGGAQVYIILAVILKRLLRMRRPLLKQERSVVLLQ